jgi:hypothetical protein
MTDNVVSRAAAALQESVRLIIGDDDYDDATKAYELAVSFEQFQDYLDRNGAVDVEKSTHELTGKLLEHLKDRLESRRRVHGFEKAKTEKDPPMDSILAIMKSGGIAKTCACIVQKGTTTISEHELVAAATAVASERHPDMSPSQAFSKVFTASTDEARVLREAINVAKLSPLAPTFVGGPDAMHEAVDNTESSEAYRQVEAMAAKMRSASPELSAAQAFERVFTDKRNAGLAVKAHVRPSATTSYPFPR